MNPRECALVIPSIRNIDLEYLRYVPEEVRIFVVDDSNGSIKANRKNMEVFDYASQERIMGGDYDLVPHKTAACRNFGFYYVWKHTDCKFILTLDDDCVTQEGYLDAYDVLGKSQELKTVIGPGWFNTLDLLLPGTRLYPRGYPYWERRPNNTEVTRSVGRVVYNMGLWDKTLDTDAMDKALFDDYRQEYEGLSLSNSVMRMGDEKHPVKFPFCGMNFGCVREALPLMYQMPMMQEFTDRYSLGRLEDIWAGYVIQTLVMLKGEAVTAGVPIVRHLKAGNLTRELCEEHYGHLITPYLYAAIDDAVAGMKVCSYAEMYVELFENVIRNEKRFRERYKVPEIYCAYIMDVSRKLVRWGKLFLS